MSAIEDRERTILVDVSSATNSADAVRQLELHLSQLLTHSDPGMCVDINTGDLLLTPGVLSKVKALIRSRGSRIRTLYSSVPQTQQTALDEGLMVRRFPPREKRAATPFYLEAAPIQRDPSWQAVDLPFTAREGRVERTAEEAALDLLFDQAPPLTQPDSPSGGLSVTHDDGSRQQVLDPQKLSALPTLYYKHNLRSGQVLESEGHVVIVGDAHSGSEIYAEGDILVWGVLGGVAHAGRGGLLAAQIRAMRIEAVQLRIGDIIARRPDRLFKGDYDYRGPEVARVNNGEIQIFEDTVER